MGWLKKLFAKKAEAPQRQDLDFATFGELVQAQPIDPPGRKVYSEYFITDAQDDNHFHWHCRVYGPEGLRAEKHGLHMTEAGARLQAMDYANKTKAAIRGAL